MSIVGGVRLPRRVLLAMTRYRPGPAGEGLALFGEVDAGDDHHRGENGDWRKWFFKPEDGERDGESRLEVGKDGGFRSFDQSLSFLISPKSDNGAANSHKKNTRYGLASKGKAGFLDENHNQEKGNADNERSKTEIDGVEANFFGKNKKGGPNKVADDD